ncbi:putative GTPase activating protein of Rab-like GTPase [Trypanosoma grayi]|uniref:putative GTPase activating protein of Rab-like GTPase n=1 Tax=Trypanosoma grayi TaxID=71804 RepID=UPI0004F435E6|nr:putative GTPase activating protein of Rab-like GTPase [Trypanosoma grayi]KEG14880.1 putative GTPase activating protein of Rab-like GTPase [Trypanosoma grayi]
MAQFPPPSLIETEDDGWSLRPPQRPADEYAAAIAGPVVSLSMITRLCRRGTPERVRAVMWQLLMGFLPLETFRWESLRVVKTKEYREIVHIVCVLDENGNVVAGEGSCRAVDVDIPRTIPSMHFFNSLEASTTENGVPVTFSPTQQSLRRIIHTLAGVNKGLGYVQGMNELVGHLLYAFASGQRDAVNDTIEGEVFFCFQTMLAYLGDDFCRSLDFDQDTGVTSTIRHFERLLQFLDPVLWRHLHSSQVRSEFYAFRWITLLFTQEFNVPDVFRVWDFLFSFGEELRSVVLYVAVAMLHYQRDELLRMNHLCELLPLLQSYPPCDVNEFLKIVMQWIDQFGFRLVQQLKVSTADDVAELRRRYQMTVPGEASWGSSLWCWMSSVRDLARHVRGER